MGKAAAKRPAAKGRVRAKGKARPSGEPKCPKCRRGCWVGGCWEVAAGGCCWSVPPRQEGVPHATACGKARSGVTPLVFLSPPSACPCRLVALWAEAEGVKWQRQGQLKRWTLCLGCHKKKWPEAGSGWVGRVGSVAVGRLVQVCRFPASVRTGGPGTGGAKGCPAAANPFAFPAAPATPGPSLLLS